jgi:hypothetical protein
MGSDSTDSPLSEVFCHRWRNQAPRRTLWIGPADPKIFPCLRSLPSDALVRLDASTAAVQLPLQGRYECAVAVELLEHLDKTEGQHLIARLRDLHAPWLLLLLTHEGSSSAFSRRWTSEDLLALGMQRIAAQRHNQLFQELYEFRITSYKATPDWLNSKYWAHPELFDKYRW